MVSMATIQMVIDDELLQAADECVRKQDTNRSAFLREAVRAYISGIQAREREELDRLGYERVPDLDSDLQGWEEVAPWPKD
jgi:metal-responsive CopG/Arc/MetJ family transcriptional regulator